VQLQHQFHALRAGDQDALARRAARERDHWINNSVASGNLRGRHRITCFRSFSPVGRGPEPCGNRSFAKRQGFGAVDFPVCRSADGASGEIARLTWANIFRTRFNFESAVNLVLYEPHRIAMSTAFGKSHTLLRRDICGWAAIPLLEKDKAVPPRIHTLSRSSSE
jgi:hypothetical protein